MAGSPIPAKRGFEGPDSAIPILFLIGESPSNGEWQQLLHIRRSNQWKSQVYHDLLYILQAATSIHVCEHGQGNFQKHFSI